MPISDNTIPIAWLHITHWSSFVYRISYIFIKKERLFVSVWSGLIVYYVMSFIVAHCTLYSNDRDGVVFVCWCLFLYYLLFLVNFLFSLISVFHIFICAYAWCIFTSFMIVDSFLCHRRYIAPSSIQPFFSSYVCLWIIPFYSSKGFFNGIT